MLKINEFIHVLNGFNMYTCESVEAFKYIHVEFKFILKCRFNVCDIVRKLWFFSIDKYSMMNQ